MTQRRTSTSTAHMACFFCVTYLRAPQNEIK